jgi:hypothetical protein
MCNAALFNITRRARARVPVDAPESFVKRQRDLVAAAAAGANEETTILPWLPSARGI